MAADAAVRTAAGKASRECQHALAQRELRRAQRRTLRAIGVDAIGGSGHGPMLSHRREPAVGRRGASPAKAL